MFAPEPVPMNLDEYALLPKSGKGQYVSKLNGVHVHWRTQVNHSLEGQALKQRFRTAPQRAADRGNGSVASFGTKTYDDEMTLLECTKSRGTGIQKPAYKNQRSRKTTLTKQAEARGLDLEPWMIRKEPPRQKTTTTRVKRRVAQRDAAKAAAAAKAAFLEQHPALAAVSAEPRDRIASALSEPACDRFCSTPVSLSIDAPSASATIFSRSPSIDIESFLMDLY